MRCWATKKPACTVRASKTRSRGGCWLKPARLEISATNSSGRVWWRRARCHQFLWASVGSARGRRRSWGRSLASRVKCFCRDDDDNHKRLELESPVPATRKIDVLPHCTTFVHQRQHHSENIDRFGRNPSELLRHSEVITHSIMFDNGTI